MAAMRTSVSSKLRQMAFDHDTHVALQSELHSLSRILVSGLLFKGSPPSTLKKRVQPILAKLLQTVGQIYVDDKGLSEDQGKTTISKLMTAFLSLEMCLQSDVEAALINDPATEDPLEVVFCYPGFKAISIHRIAHILYKHKIPLLPRMLAELAHEDTGIDIHPGAQIGSHFFIDHGTGVVIGETAEIGDNVTIYQGVTLGAKHFKRDEAGHVIKGEKRHPVLGNDVTVYSGATILGRIHIGSGSVIGGNVWLTQSIEDGSRITQQPYVSKYFIDGDGI